MSTQGLIKIFAIVLFLAVTIMIGQNFTFINSSRLNAYAPGPPKDADTPIQLQPISDPTKSAGETSREGLSRFVPMNMTPTRDEKSVLIQTGRKSLSEIMGEDYFGSSDLGKTLKNIERKAGKKVTLLNNSKVENGGNGTDYELELSAFQERPHLKYVSGLGQAQCVYSADDHGIKVQLLRPISSSSTLGLDYLPSAESSVLNMQMHW